MPTASLYVTEFEEDGRVKQEHVAEFDSKEMPRLRIEVVKGGPGKGRMKIEGIGLPWFVPLNGCIVLEVKEEA